MMTFRKNIKAALLLAMLSASVARAVDHAPGEISFANFSQWASPDQLQHLRFVTLAEFFQPSMARIKGYSAFCDIGPLQPVGTIRWYRLPVRRMDVRFLRCTGLESVEF